MKRGVLQEWVVPARDLTVVHWSSYLRLSREWHLNSDEKKTLLRLTPLQTLSSWHASVFDLNLSASQLERLSYILAIYNILTQLFSDSQWMLRWVRATHQDEIFKLETPLDFMIKAEIRQLRHLASHLLQFENALAACTSIISNKNERGEFPKPRS
ncbi:MAG: hypothetical protein V4629_07855 [Pseudomonadota bacterium]